jgi:glycerophosphoryl diester phosphodiesterase
MSPATSIQALAPQAPARPNWPYPTLFAHRGAGTLAPENTLAAIRIGHEQGFTAFEFDVKLSADGIALLMHDDTLERTSNGSGAVKDKTMAELARLDAGGWHSAKFRGETIPRFSAVAKYMHGLGLVANVEIKPCPGRDAETGKLVAELCQSLWQDRLVKPLLSSFSVEALTAARAVSRDLPMGLLTGEASAAHLPIIRALNCISVDCDHQYITADLVKLFHGEGVRIFAYTVNDPARAAELIDLGVDAICTDAIELMAKRFPERLHDGGNTMVDPQDFDDSWLGAIPPMP